MGLTMGIRLLELTDIKRFNIQLHAVWKTAASPEENTSFSIPAITATFAMTYVK